MVSIIGSLLLPKSLENWIPKFGQIRSHDKVGGVRITPDSSFQDVIYGVLQEQIEP